MNYLIKMLSELLFSIFASFGYYALTRIFVKVGSIYEYQGFTEYRYAQEDIKSFGLKVFSFPVYSVCVSLILLLLGNTGFLPFLIFVPVWYTFIYAVIITKLERWMLINKRDLVTVLTLGFLFNFILVNYFVLETSLFEIPNAQRLSRILPDRDNLKSDFWWFVSGYIIISLFPQRSYEQKVDDLRLRNYIRRTYSKFKSRFSDLTRELNKYQSRTIYAIMIYEDFNRSGIDRALERIVGRFVKGPMTTGIMQVSSNKLLTDEESVAIVAEKLTLTTSNDYNEHYNQTLYNFASNYNPGDSNYYESVRIIEEVIKDIEESNASDA